MDKNNFLLLLEKRDTDRLINHAFRSAGDLANILKLLGDDDNTIRKNKNLCTAAVLLLSQIFKSLPEKVSDKILREIVEVIASRKNEEKIEIYLDIFYETLAQSFIQNKHRKIFSRLTNLLRQDFLDKNNFAYLLLLGAALVQSKKIEILQFMQDIVLQSSTDEKLRNQLKFFVYFFASFHFVLVPIVPANEEYAYMIYREGMKAFGGFSQNGWQNINIFSFKETQDIWKKILEEVYEIIDSDSIGESQMKFESEIEKIEKKAAELFQQIKQGIRFPLDRPYKIEIDLPILSDLYGVHSAEIFDYPENPLPGINLKFEWRLFGYYGHFNFALDDEARIAESPVFCWRAMQKFLRCVAIDICYRTVIKNYQTCEFSESVGGNGKKKRRHMVRPFRRNLPPNWKASERAKSEALKVYHEALPSGKTFVRSHERGINNSELCEKPLFRYTKRCFQNLWTP